MNQVDQWLLVAKIALAAAAAVPGVDPKIMGYITTGLNAAQAGYDAVQEAQAGVDPTKLNPIDPVV